MASPPPATSSRSCATKAADAAGTANPLAGRIDRAIGFGLSQSGRYLHDYLYLGFNADEAGRTVFEGLMPHISGGKKTFTNYRFSQPGRSPYQHADMLYPGADFPFTYPVITDALTGKSDGFLARCLAAGNCPKIIKTDSEIEFYQQRASLVVTDTKATRSRCPTMSGSSSSRTCSIMRWPTPNPRWRRPAPSRPIRSMPARRLRALLVALDAWISNGTLPPASRYPSRADGTLVPPTIDEVGFPRIPGFGYPARIAQPTAIKSDEMPPSKGAAYPVFVPKTDADGRRSAGIRLPTLEAPSATHTGWNLRKAGFGEGELCDNNGSMIPSRRRSEERLKRRRSTAVDGRALSEPGRSRGGDRKGRAATWCRTGCCWKRMQNCSRRTSTEGELHSNSNENTGRNTNADATQYDACLHRRRSDHEQPNRSGESRAAIDAGEFRHSRRRLRLPHPYPPDPAKFPFFAGRVYTPELASPEEMTALHKALHMERVVIVTPSIYGPDNSATLFGMKARGATARGVAVIDDKTSESDLDAMDKAGFRGIRLNLATGGVNDPTVGRPRFSGRRRARQGARLACPAVHESCDDLRDQGSRRGLAGAGRVRPFRRRAGRPRSSSRALPTWWSW